MTSGMPTMGMLTLPARPFSIRSSVAAHRLSRPVALAHPAWVSISIPLRVP